MRALLAMGFSLIILLASTVARAECNNEAPCRPPPVVTTHMRSIPLFATGVVFDVLGGAATAGGVGMIAVGSQCGDPRGKECGFVNTLLDLGGIVALVGGGVLLAIGIPLTIVGGAQVPDQKRALLRPTGNGLALTF